ncbi:MAG: hypothetical protein NDI61_04665 [Bdellovibrionaceae bacterium]|nr:hypothetical protein [Pseudobdellovibrionaceae bacterium]
MRQLGIAVVLFCLLSSCSRSCERGEPVVLKVGDFTITPRMIEQREQVMRIYYPQAVEIDGLQQLVDAYLKATVLKQNGHVIDDPILANEAKRIESSTLMPEMLARVRAVFDPDPEAYLRVYVLPIYAERVIYFEFFLRHSNLQAPSLARAQDFARTVRARPAEFKSLAEKAGAQTARLTVSAREGVKWGEPHRSSEAPPPGQQALPGSIASKVEKSRQQQDQDEGRRWVQEIVGRLKVGEVFEQVIDGGERWQVVRYLGRVQGVAPEANEVFEFEAAVFPKADYAQWLEAEKSRVPIVVHDQVRVSKIRLPASGKR